ncbi:nucleotidyltransferase domain-containing protein [Neisseriaceae bacterium CLB008]|nr:nucleotidyltransferase domain-containing protein [Neisseriaceae bacterium]
MQGVDERGYISRMPQGPWLQAYQPLLDEVSVRLIEALPELVHSLYVYGSVARGTAVPGRSDLDLTVVLQKVPNEAQARILADIRQGLAADYPIVSKVDFDLGVLADVLAPESALRWGGWLKHYCRHLAGPDLSLSFDLLKPSRDLALALNGDCVERLSDYVTALMAATEHAEVVRLQREASRLLIRATMVLRQETDTTWPNSLSEYVALAGQQHHEQAPVWAYFLAQAEQPRADLGLFVTKLETYLSWLRQSMAAMA